MKSFKQFIGEQKERSSSLKAAIDKLTPLEKFKLTNTIFGVKQPGGVKNYNNDEDSGTARAIAFLQRSKASEPEIVKAIEELIQQRKKVVKKW